MNNELLFSLQTIIVGATALLCLRLGKEALVAYITTQAIIANLFVLKQITLFGYTATAADVFIVGSVLGLNLLQEYFGKEIAKHSIWISFSLLTFYTIVSQIHLNYQPGPEDFSHIHFYSLLQFMPRITIASMIVYFIVQHIDAITYYSLKRLFAGKWLVVRNTLTIMFSQAIDTVLFGFLGLYGIIPNIVQVMIVSYVIKLIALLLVAPFISWTRKIAEPF